ncbi:hypothetical protein Tsubulata_046378 [Turnera subulata]|uniref:GRF-type domain-containing protein n=1 Tax=Turnera subulata TaxID=218843 RepID=A0A9Q0JGP1_9ROSI|nr:hypothetical protein Tsubulata_046378 [Turnera subulata]
MSSSSSSSSFALRVELDLWDDVLCYCIELAPILPQWSRRNPGRQYYGCGSYKYGTGGKNCGIFEWATRETDVRCQIVINPLREENADMLREIEELMIAEEKLRKENNGLKDAVQELKRSKRDLMRAVICLFVVVIFLMIVFVL